MGNSGLIVISKCTRLMCFLFFSTYATIYSTRNKELMTWWMFKTALLHSHTFQTMLKLLQIPKESVCCPSCSSFASCCTGCQCGPFLVFELAAVHSNILCVCTHEQMCVLLENGFHRICTDILALQ